MIQRNRRNPLEDILLRSETASVRFWFGLTTLFFGIFMSLNGSAQPDYKITFIMMPNWVWGLGLMLSGAAVIFGAITSKHGILGLCFECILGTALWVGIAVSSMMNYGSPSAVTIGALISIWLLIRYPSINVTENI